MQKKSRFLTGLLSAVMALTLFALPATAAGDAVTPTIDTSRTGSLTINKYEGNDPDVGKDKPLNGVTFKIYQVAEVKQTNTNGVIDTEIVPVKALRDQDANIAIGVDTEYKDIKSAVDAAVESKSLPEKGSKTTGKDDAVNNAAGKVKFTSLAVGVYLVVEDDAPDQVVDKSANFLVSIPMMKVDRTGWEYDITANPKNTGVYAGVTLQKKAHDLSLDGKFTENNLQGVVFKLEKYVNNAWTTTNTAKVGSGDNAQTVTETAALTTDVNGQILVDGLTPGEYRFVEISAPNGYIVDNAAEYKFTVTTSGKIKEAGAADSTAIEKFVINAVNEKPDMAKTVANRGTGKNAQETDYSVGDKVPYTIKVTVPKKIADLSKFIVTDTPKNLAFVNAGNYKLTITDSNQKNLTEDNEYKVTPVKSTVEGDQSIGFKVEFDPKKLTPNTVLTLHYYAELLDQASTGVDGNSNTAKLVYSNYTNEDSAPQGTPKESEIDDSVIVYTFEINIVKKANDANGQPLKDVEFDLYQLFDSAAKKPESATAISTEDATKLGLTTPTGTQVWAKISSKKTGADGKLQFKGLSNGTYKLVETKTHKDYNLLKEPVDVTLNVEYQTEWTEKSSYEIDAGGMPTRVKRVYKSNGFTGNNVNDNQYVETTIINKKGFNLPTTGGFGTLLFSGIGALLVVGGIGVLMGTKKKKDNA